MANDKEKDEKKEKWDFDDYAFTITGIIVGFLLIVPEIVYSMFGFEMFGGGIGDMAATIAEDALQGFANVGMTFDTFRALSPMLFLLTLTICFVKDAIEARKTGGYEGSVFTHTFESLVEDAIYIATTTIMVYGAVFFGAMYASWLAGPVTWVLFIFIFPLVKRKSDTDGAGDERKPWLLLGFLALGVVAEVITGAWIALPLAWLLICAVKFALTIHHGIKSIDDVFTVQYHAYSVVLMAVGVIFDFWLLSWTAYMFAMLVCWVMTKFGRFKKAKAESEESDS